MRGERRACSTNWRTAAIVGGADDGRSHVVLDMDTAPSDIEDAALMAASHADGGNGYPGSAP